jgi:DNA replication protein DnaC
MRDVAAELKELRLHGMAGAWADLVAQRTLAALESSRWLIEHLLEVERGERAMRSISYQMSTAKFPMHRDLAGFDFEHSQVERALINQLSDLSFTEAAHNVVFIGGPGTGKTHLATALGVAGITRHGQTGTLLLYGGSGQRTRAREKPEQAGAHCLQSHAHGSGDSRRTGLPAL